MALQIAISGGIGTGKSTVASLFRSLGIPVIQLDKICHELINTDTEVQNSIAEVFGTAILRSEGRQLREKLRNIVFKDTEKRKALEQILHPRARQHTAKIKARLHTPYVLTEVPLLNRKTAHKDYDRILVAHCTDQTRKQRIQQRDGLSTEQIQKITATQMSTAEFKALATETIDTSTSNLQHQVGQLHERYQELART